MTSDESYRERCERLHEEACARQADFYIDPKTGYQVSTRIFLMARKHCCESGCRHCPYGFKASKK